MFLIGVVIHREELLDEILSMLVESELPDSVVIESRSGLELLERDLPIFAGLRSIIPGGMDFSRLILCVVEEEEHGQEALALIRRLGGGEKPPGEARNTAFLIPLSGVEHF